jgi:carbamoyltransferase
MTILGISAFYHDSAAAILVDGKIIAAAQEERFTRVKHDNSFPTMACEFCLNEARLSIEDIDKIVFYEKPFLKFERIIETHINVAPRSICQFIQTIPIWLKDKLNMRRLIKREISKLGAFNGELLFSEHHLSHAAFAYYTSGFKDSAILTIDAVGEWTTTSIMHAKGGNIKVIKEQHFPHSVGMLYSAFTYFLGFKVNSDEYKVMGLAPYGSKNKKVSQYIELIEKYLVDIHEDGSIELNMKYFSFTHSLTMVNEKAWAKLFGLPRRMENDVLTDDYVSLAYAIQNVLETIYIRLAKTARSYSGNLCISGGTALNCVANGLLLKSNIFNKIHVPVSPGDAGASIGSCLVAYYIAQPQNAQTNASTEMTPYLGPEYSNDHIRHQLEVLNVKYEYVKDSRFLCDKTSKLIADGHIIGWFQGRMEFGPRALGNRSILADARNPQMKDKINSLIKFRESFRPFAPAVMYEFCDENFDLNVDSPYMMFTCGVKNDKLPAVTHVDNSARVQTVKQKDNPKFHELLNSFYRLTGCPVILNTSFNVMGEPIVCSPADALSTFYNSGLEYCVIGNYIVKK